jgi:hypothetical protein
MLQATFMPHVLCPDCGLEMKYNYLSPTNEKYVTCVTDGKLYYLAGEKGKVCSLYGQKFEIPVIYVELKDYER